MMVFVFVFGLRNWVISSFYKDGEDCVCVFMWRCGGGGALAHFLLPFSILSVMLLIGQVFLAPGNIFSTLQSRSGKWGMELRASMQWARTIGYS